MATSFLRSWAGNWLLLTLTACSSGGNEPAAPADRIAFNDFESLEGWTAPTPSLTKEKAHSGRFSVKVEPGIDYALGYTNPLGQASAAKFQKLTLQGWALQAGPKATAALVVELVDASGKNLFYQMLPLGEVVKSLNKWTEFRREFVLPPTVAPNQQLKVYLWRASAEQPAYLDDLELIKE